MDLLVRQESRAEPDDSWNKVGVGASVRVCGVWSQATIGNSFLSLGSRMKFAVWLHLLAVVVWVGGMFFAYVALRPAAQALPPPQRLPLLAAALSRFVAWAAGAIVILVVSGIAMIVLLGGMRAVGIYVHVMIGLGLVMILVYGHLVASSLKRLRAAVAASDWPSAGTAMTMARRLVGVNLVLGLVTITVAVLGRG